MTEFLTLLSVALLTALFIALFSKKKETRIVMNRPYVEQSPFLIHNPYLDSTGAIQYNVSSVRNRYDEFVFNQRKARKQWRQAPWTRKPKKK